MTCKRLSKLIMILLVMTLGSSRAWSAQFEDNFDNATYDGSLNSNLWWADSNAVVGTDVTQDAASHALKIGGQSDAGAFRGVISKQLVDLNTADRSKGTLIEIKLNSIDISASSADWRDLNFMVFLVDEAIQDANNHFTYPNASTVFYNDIKGNNTFLAHSMWTKDDTQDGNGWWVADRPAASVPAAAYTFPMTIKYYVNQYFAVMTANDVPVYACNFQNPTAAGAGFTDNKASLRIFLENSGDGRGTVSLDSVTVGDAGAAVMPIPANLSAATGLVDKFDATQFDGKFDTSKFYLFSAGPWGSAEQSGGAMNLISPNAQYEECGLATREIPLGASDYLQVSYDVKDFKQRVDEALNGNSTLTVIDDALNSFAYFHFPRTALTFAMIRQYNSNQVNVLAFSKPFGSSFAQGTLLQEQLVTVNQFPFNVTLKFDHANYELKFDGATVMSGAHNVTFSDRVAVQLAARNEGGDSRTTLTIDNFNMGINGPGTDQTEPNAVRTWTLY